MKTQHSQKHSIVENSIRLKSRQYDIDFKKKVALFAERRGNQEAKRRFGVNESNIRRWRKIYRDHVVEKVAVRQAVANRNTKRKTGVKQDVPNKIDSMPLELRLKSPAVASTSEQEQILHSHPLSPTKLKVTRQSKPKEPSPKPITPPPIDEICLKWNSHHGNMQSMFPALLLKEQYVDATLVAEGQTLKCHRMILSSCSPYFEEVLSNISPYQHPVLFMKDTPFWILKCLCDFMYTGEVMISHDKLNELLSTAETLKIKGLAGKPDVPNEDLLKEPLQKHIKEEKKDDFTEKEPEKKEPPKDKKRHYHAAATTAPIIPEPAPPKNSKIPKTEPPPVKASKIPKLNTYNDSPVVKSSSKAPKVNTTHVEPSQLKTSSTKVLRSSSTLKKIERADKLLIKEAISKGDILDPFDLLEPVYEEVQKEPKPPSIPTKAKEAAKNVPVKKNVQKKVKKRKISDDRDESPPPVLSRKGTRSRPNKKIPRFYHSGFDNSTPKIQESAETTIVREPHTSQAESQASSGSTQAEVHTDQVEIPGEQADSHLESHMDQADPLFQLTDIKAEPFDVEESTIEIEDNVVTFGEPDTSMTEEELLEDTFESVMNFEEKSVPEKPSVTTPFKKIRVTRQQVLLEAEKTTNMVKIVDVDKIKVSADLLEEDPLNLNPTVDNNIKIMNVESISENVDSSGGSKEPTSENSEVGFKLCEVAESSKQPEENPLGFQIAIVVSEKEENIADEEEIKSAVPVCQIAEVFSETENETNGKNDDKTDDSKSEKVSEDGTENTCGESETPTIKQSFTEDNSQARIELKESTSKNETTPDAFEGFDIWKTPEEQPNVLAEVKSDTLSSTSDSLTNVTDNFVNTDESCSDSKTSDDLPNTEIVFKDAASLDPSVMGTEKNPSDKDLDSNLSRAADDLEPLQEVEEGADDINKTSNDVTEASDGLIKVVNNESKMESVEENAKPLKTVDNVGLIDENLCGISEDLGVVAEDLGETADDVSETADELGEVSDDLSQPAAELSQPTGDLSQHVDDLSQPADDLSQPADDLSQPDGDLCQPTVDLSQPADDFSRPDDLRQPADEPSQPADEPSQPADDCLQPADDLIQPADDCNQHADNPNQTADDFSERDADPCQPPDLRQIPNENFDKSDESDDNIASDVANLAQDQDLEKPAISQNETSNNFCRSDDLVKTGIDESANVETNTPAELENHESADNCANESLSVEQIITDENIPDVSANVISPKVATHQAEQDQNVFQSNRNFEELKPNICTNSIEDSSCLEDTFDQAIMTNDSSNQDIEMPTDESRTKDPVLANAVPYTNEDLPVVSAQNDDVLPMEVCEESYSQGPPSFDQTPNSFELVTDVAQNDATSYGTPGFHIAQVISEQIALNEECGLTNQPMDTSDNCFDGSMTSSNELEMIVNDLTKIVGDTQRLDSNMEHEDIAESLENLLEK